MIKVRATGIDLVVRSLRARAVAMDRAMARATQRAALDIFRESRANFATVTGRMSDAEASAILRNKRKRKTARNLAAVGSPLPPPGPLRTITGNLRRSMTWRVEKRGSVHVGIVGNAAAYGRIHEVGGTVKRQRGASTSTAHVPARPYLGPALERRRAAVLSYFAQAVREAAGNG